MFVPFGMKKAFGLILGLVALNLIMKARAAQKFSCDLKNVFIAKRDGKYQLFAKVAIDNPTKESVTINGANINFTFQQKKIGAVVYTTKTVFAPQQKTEVAFPVSVQPNTLLSLVGAWLKGSSLNIDAKGTINFSGLNIPVEKTINLV